MNGLGNFRSALNVVVMRGLTSFLTSVTDCLPQHVVANGSYLDHSKATGVAETSIERKLKVVFL